MHIDQLILDKLIEDGMDKIIMAPNSTTSPYAAYQEWARRISSFAQSAYEAGYRQAVGDVIIKGAVSDGQ